MHEGATSLFETWTNGIEIRQVIASKGTLERKEIKIKYIRQISKRDGRFNKMKKKIRAKKCRKIFLELASFFNRCQNLTKDGFLLQNPAGIFFASEAEKYK